MSIETLARELAEICLAECLFPGCGCARCRKAREVLAALHQQVFDDVIEDKFVTSPKFDAGDFLSKSGALCVECRAPVSADERLCWACDQKVRTIEPSLPFREMEAGGWKVQSEAKGETL